MRNLLAIIVRPSSNIFSIILFHSSETLHEGICLRHYNTKGERMKRLILVISLVSMLLMAGIVTGAAGDADTKVIPVTYGNSSDHSPPPPFGNVPGGVMDDKVYISLAPCYTEKMIKTYGPVPAFTMDRQIVSRGILTDYTIADRNALYTKLDNVYESMKKPFNSKYAYPNGPVISYGYDALGSVSVGIYEKSSVDQEMLDEMYSVIAAESKKQGIDTVPVLFYSEPMAELDLGRTDMWRPVIGGVQTGTPVGAFTVGFAATLGGQTGFVTTGHGGGVGTTVYQPNPSYPIGTITISSGGLSSDSSWVSYSNSAGQIFESSSSQPWVYGWSDPSVGMNVYMSGITSGVSTGTVLYKNSAWNTYFAKMIDNQWFADYAGAEGDSGAPVYYKDSSGHIQLTGVHWGHTTSSIFSPISNVLSDL